MSTLVRIALVSSIAASFCAVGCAAKNDGSPAESLSSSEAALVEDNGEADDVEGNVEVGIEEPTSGAEPSDPGGGLDPSTPDAQRDGLLRTNPGKFFQPAGCITTDVARNGNVIVVTHTFKDCTGPAGLRSFNGVLTATWTFASGQVSVKREATDFKIDGATLSGSQTVTWSKSGSVFTKTRVGDWSGTTAKGKPIAHTANYTVTYDATAKCVTRDGSSETQIGGRTLDRSITGYKRCGIGELGCPESGKIVLSRTKGGDTASITLEFLGGRQVEITRPNGSKVTRSLVCRVAS